MKVIEIIEKLIEKRDSYGDITPAEAVEAVWSASIDGRESQEAFKHMIGVVNDNDGYAAKDEAGLRELALEYTDLIEPSAETTE